MSKPKRTKFATACDLHAPYTDPVALEWATGVYRNHKPDVFIANGDVLNADAASRWNPENPADLKGEYETAADILRQLRVRSGAKRCVFVFGNHDDNLLRSGRLPEALRSACDPRENAKLGRELTNWNIIPYIHSERGAFWLGQVCHKHGFSANQELEAIQFAGSVPNALVVGGHDHKPCDVTRCMRTRRIPLPVWYCNGGTLGPIQPEYAYRQDCRSWGHAAIIGECDERVRLSEDRHWAAEVLRMPGQRINGVAW